MRRKFSKGVGISNNLMGKIMADARNFTQILAEQAKIIQVSLQALKFFFFISLSREDMKF